jgi:hypothetical protein
VNTCRYLVQKEEQVKDVDIENSGENVTWKFWKEDINRGKCEGVRIQLRRASKSKQMFVLRVHYKFLGCCFMWISPVRLFVN